MPAGGDDDPRFGFLSAADYATARALLTAAGYAEKAIFEMVGLSADSLPRDGGALLALGEAERGSSLETLILLFLIGAPVEADRARQALQPMDAGEWAEAGLIAVEGNLVRGLVRLVPFRGLWLAHDRPEQKQRADFVMGVGSSTVRLMDVAIRRPVRAMLDLGSGCGTQGLFAARHSDRVVATDTNPRAVQFTHFNAQINDLRKVETIGGDLLEPVADRKFDLVLSNPPFVISPDRRYIYRDGGLPGDGFCRRLIREVPAVLEEGGYCQILCNWAHQRREAWQDRLSGWFEGTGCDAWVMRTETEEVAAYATTWIRQTEPDDPARLGETYERWLEYYDRQGIESISTGIITMRRSSGRSNWIRIDEIPPRILGPCGDDIELGFALRDFLETVGDEAGLLEIRPRVSPVARLHQRLAPAAGVWESEEMELRREQGLAAAARVDQYVAGLVGRCDGRRTLRDLIHELAVALGRDPNEVAGPMLAIVRRLIEQAILLPEGVFG
ncbi:MAG: methyltransferase [Candidatus Rokubacteria bacterium]|nr:methyltransferase [Candidatus Rokubacteria bacterium]